VTDLAVSQRGEEFRLSWTLPGKEEGGRPLRDLTGCRLYRREPLPPAQDCPNCQESWKLLRAIDLAYLQDVQRRGDRLFFTDGTVRTGTGYEYQVLAMNRPGAVSRPSNRPRLAKVAPPLPPVLQVIPGQTEVRLEFVAIPFPAKEAIVGYNIYRQALREAYPETPLNAEPLPGPAYDDKQLVPGTIYRYVVRTVARIDGQLVESDPSNEAAATLLPPE
ncbi:MAG TPA: fibronectin type III domain-containing protein, partial [Geobacteraceae bacterium]